MLRDGDSKARGMRSPASERVNEAWANKSMSVGEEGGVGREEEGKWRMNVEVEMRSEVK